MKRRWTRGRTFWTLMAVSAVAALLDPRWTGWLRRVVEPLTWLTGGIAHGSAAVLTLPEAGRELTPEEIQRLATDNEELRRQLQHQSLQLEAAHDLLDQLTGLPDQLRTESVKIRLASVVGGDADPRRETLRISAGALQQVRVGDWVVAGRAFADADSELTGEDLLQRQWVIGRVSETGQFRATVQLATDPSFPPTQVWLATPGAGGALRVAERAAVLEGLGDGRMVVRDATLQPAAGEPMLVLVPIGTRLPTPLQIGAVTESRPLRESPLHYDLMVAPPGAAAALTHVFVLMLDR